GRLGGRQGGQARREEEGEGRRAGHRRRHAAAEQVGDRAPDRRGERSARVLPQAVRRPPGRRRAGAVVPVLPEGFFTPAVAELVPYEPGKPIEELQRELGLERVVKLASNEGPFGPFEAALEAMSRAERELNRYPDGGAWALRTALAERHGVAFGQVAVGGGADGVIDQVSQAALTAGDEVVCGWPSFPSYAIDARKLGAVPRLVPLRDHRYDLDALLAAIGPRTKLVYVCQPNNPTGTA